MSINFFSKIYFSSFCQIPIATLYKRLGNNSQDGSCMFWYSTLSEYRANNIKEIDNLYRLIESLSFQLQLEQVI